MVTKRFFCGDFSKWPLSGPLNQIIFFLHVLNFFGVILTVLIHDYLQVFQEY